MSQRSADSGSGRIGRSRDWFVECVVGLFLLAVFMPSLLLLYGGAPVGAAILALPFSFVFLVIMIFTSGSDLMDIAVNSVIFLVLTGFVVPTFVHARQRAAENRIAVMEQRVHERRAEIDEARWRHRIRAEWLKKHLAMR